MVSSIDLKQTCQMIESCLGIVCGSHGEELRVYTIDGKCHVLLEELRDGQRHLSVLENTTSAVHHEVFEKANPPVARPETAVKAEVIEEDEDTSASTNKQLRIWGAAASGNGLFDAFAYT